jgi:hypothetical protein
MDAVDGRAYLVSLIDQRLRRSGERVTNALDLAELKGVAQGLVASGALTTEAMRDLLAEKGVEPPLGAVVLQDDVRATFTQANNSARRAAVESLAVDRLTGADTREFLSRVIPAVGQELDIADRKASLISLDVWSRLFVLRFAYPSSDLRFSTDVAAAHWYAEDDRKTRFDSCGSAWDGIDGMAFHQQYFKPGIPDGVSELEFSVELRGAKSTASIRVL